MWQHALNYIDEQINRIMGNKYSTLNKKLDTLMTKKKHTQKNSTKKTSTEKHRHNLIPQRMLPQHQKCNVEN